MPALLSNLRFNLSCRKFKKILNANTCLLSKLSPAQKLGSPISVFLRRTSPFRFAIHRAFSFPRRNRRLEIAHEKHPKDNALYDRSGVYAAFVRPACRAVALAEAGTPVL